MSTLSLMQVVRSAGFSGESAYIMYGICCAESGGNAWAFNPNATTGDLSYGLAQINMIGDMGNGRRKAFNIQSNNDLFNPYTNLQAAWEVSNHGTNWGPWTTYGIPNGVQQTQTQLAKNGQSDYKVTYTSEFGSPNPNVDQNAGKYLGGSSTTGASGAQINYATKGHWTSFGGKRIPDPPTPVVYGTPSGSDPSGAHLAKLPNQSQYNAILSWMDQYNDGTYVSKKYKGTKPGFQTLVADYTDTIAYQPKGGVGDTQYPDPGAAQAGIGPVSWTSSLGNILAWLTNSSNWKRIGLFTLGAIILIFAAADMFGKSDAVSNIASSIGKAPVE